MLKKTIRRLGALAMVLAMAVSVFAVNASAAGDTKLSSDPTEASFKKTVTIDGDTTDHVLAPNTTFEFDVAAGDTHTVKIGDNSAYVKAGPMNPAPTIDSTTFTPETVAKSDRTGYEVTGKIKFAAGTFTAPGIYEYKLTEKANSYDGITVDNRTIYMYVYVVNKEENGKVTGYKVQEAILATYDATTQKMTKGAGFINTYTVDETNAGKIDLTKVVEGAFGNKEYPWEFNITVKGPTGEKYKTNSDVVLTSGESKTIYLKNDEHFIIYGVTAKDEFTIVETKANTEGYKTTFTVGKTETRTEYTSAGIKDSGAKLVTVYNKEQNTPATGVIMTIAPYALMVVLAGAFAVVFLSRRNRAE